MTELHGANWYRSADWYRGDDRSADIHRAWMRRGNPADAIDGSKPQIAIANTASDLSTCNSHLDEVAESVKTRGVGVRAVCRTTCPCHPSVTNQVRPTAMLLRNLAAMTMEEMFRGNPIDGLVLLGGCDKTIPALLMAAASVNIPAIVVPGGPMMTGYFRNAALGCGTDVWALSEEARAGTITNGMFTAVEAVDRSGQGALQHDGHGVDDGRGRRGARHDDARASRARRPRTRSCCRSRTSRARLIVDMVAQRPPSPATCMSKESFLNAIVAVGRRRRVDQLPSCTCSAIAGRARHRPRRSTTSIAAGARRAAHGQPPAERRTFLMDDLLPTPGGVLAVLVARCSDLLHPRSDHRDRAPARRLPRRQPRLRRRSSCPEELAADSDDAGIAVLRGNLAPNGAIIKPSAASPHLMLHTGRAVVFEFIEDLHARIDDPDLDVTADSVLVLRGCGPRGYPGMPEVGNMPIPHEAARAGRARHGARSATHG